MAKQITSASEIPKAPFYVLANDEFMSGWGPAEGKTNTIILPADSYEEAEIIADNAKARSEMKRVRIVSNKPKLQGHVIYSLMNRREAARWYTRGGFQPSDLEGLGAGEETADSIYLGNFGDVNPFDYHGFFVWWRPGTESRQKGRAAIQQMVKDRNFRDGDLWGIKVDNWCDSTGECENEELLLVYDMGVAVSDLRPGAPRGWIDWDDVASTVGMEPSELTEDPVWAWDAAIGYYGGHEFGDERYIETYDEMARWLITRGVPLEEMESYLNEDESGLSGLGATAIEELAMQAVKQTEKLPISDSEERERLSKWATVVGRTRDSGLMEISNFESIYKDLETQFPDDVEIHRFGHWGVGWIEEVMVRVYDDVGNITPAFEAAVEWRERLEDYPVADEDDYSMREYEATIENIETEGRNLVRDGAPEGWASEVYSWLGDNNESAVENVDDQGGFPSEEEIAQALDALDLLDPDYYEE